MEKNYWKLLTCFQDWRWILSQFFPSIKHAWNILFAENLMVFQSPQKTDKNDWNIFRYFLSFLNKFSGLKKEDCYLRFFSAENKIWLEYLLKSLGILCIAHTQFCIQASFSIIWTIRTPKKIVQKSFSEISSMYFLYKK